MVLCPKFVSNKMATSRHYNDSEKKVQIIQERKFKKKVYVKSITVYRYCLKIIKY